MKDVSSEAERYKVYDSSLKFMMNIKTDLTNIGKNYTVSDKDNGEGFDFSLRRSASLADVKKQRLDMMPGFKFSWYYSGLDVVEPKAKYPEREDTKAFVRKNLHLYFWLRKQPNKL